MSTFGNLITASIVSAGFMLGAPTLAVAAGKQPQLCMGEGYGFVTLPTAQYEGWFNAELFDDKGEVKFTIDARITSNGPSMTFGPGVRVLYGGIFGSLREATPPGVHLIVQQPTIARVEGYWMLENDNTGTFHLATFVRDASGGMTKTGVLDGVMRVRELIFPPHNPLPPAVLKKKLFASGGALKQTVPAIGGGTPPCGAGVMASPSGLARPAVGFKLGLRPALPTYVPSAPGGMTATARQRSLRGHRWQTGTTPASFSPTVGGASGGASPSPVPGLRIGECKFTYRIYF